MSEAINLCLFATDKMLGGEIFISHMGATDILTLAKAFVGANNFDYVVIGEKIGEKLYEELITDVEVKRTLKFDGRFVVLPDLSSPFMCEKKSLFDLQYGGCENVQGLMRSDNDLIDYETLSRLIEGVKN
jgi:FlaA1/EpsC-like NDP-sugar epimerase